MSADKKRPLRSQAWFGRQDAMGFYYRSFLKSSGFPQDQFEGRPVIGICNTWSELTPCNAHFRNHRRTRKVGSPKPRSMGC
jgi:dihydroxy-acid dehydratase